MAAFISRISARIAEYIYNDQVEYQPGQLPYSRTGTTLSTQPRQAKREFSQQNILIYEESPEELRQENVLAQIIPNRDGRERIGNTTTWPNSFHAQLSINFNGRTYGGSGAMVGPHHLLTCGHNVYDTKAKAWADEITVYPALNEAQAPFGFAKAIKAYTFSNWTERGERQYDIALLILDKSIGKETGWGGLLSEEDQDLSKEEVNIYGYPGDKGFKQMWGMKHKIHKLEPEEFQYLIDTNGGQSGSAIWIFNHGTPKILGVHTLGSNFGNFGVRLSQQKFQMIVEKIAETYKLKQQTIHKISSPKALVAKTSQNIPPTAFGKAKWARYFGDVGEEPPLPPNIEQVLSEDCPFWPGNKIRDTHLLVLIPETVNGKTLTVGELGELIRYPKEGHPMWYNLAEDRLMNLSSGKSHWVLMTKGVIPGTLGRYEQDYNSVLRSRGKYQMPSVLEAATCILMEHVMTGTKLYWTNPYTCTRCKENSGETVIGGFDEGINMGLDPRLAHVGIGLGALRPLISSNTVPKAISAAKKALPTSNFSAPDPMDLSITPSTTLKSEIPPSQAELDARAKQTALFDRLKIERRDWIWVSQRSFGAAKWAQYFGDVGIRPPPPPNIYEILNAPCPFWHGKKVHETHILTLIPQTVNGKPLTLQSLGELVQKPLQGPATKYSSFNLGQHTDQPAPTSHWTLLSRDVIPNSRSKRYAAQAELSQQYPGYEIPHILDATVSIFMEHVQSGTRLYPTNTRCQEKYNARLQLAVGGFAAGGLAVRNVYDGEHEGVGVGLSRKFSESYQLEKPATFVPQPSFQTPLPTKQPQPNPVQPFKGFSQQAPSPAPAVSFFSQPSMQSTLPPIAFGKAKWIQYFGDVGIEPPLPPDIHQILSAPCPFWSGMKVHETHLLTLIPQTVNGRPLTLETLGELVRKPLQGYATKYSNFNLGEYKDQPPPASHWTLISRDVIPRSRNQYYTDQQRLVNRYPGYEVPHILDGSVSLFMEHVQSGTRLYSDNPWKHTQCQEKYSADLQLLIGGFGEGGLIVDCFSPAPAFFGGGHGVGAQRKF